MLSQASAADRSFENIVVKEEIAQNEKFLLLPKSETLFLCFITFTTYQQQMSLKEYCHKYGKSLYMKV